jgi:hypothetical protein
MEIAKENKENLLSIHEIAGDRVEFSPIPCQNTTGVLLKSSAFSSHVTVLKITKISEKIKIFIVLDLVLIG